MTQRSKSDACVEQIQDEVQRQVKRCVCPKQYHMHKITDGQYRVRCFDCFLALSSFITDAAAAVTVIVFFMHWLFYIYVGEHHPASVSHRSLRLTPQPPSQKNPVLLCYVWFSHHHQSSTSSAHFMYCCDSHIPLWLLFIETGPDRALICTNVILHFVILFPHHLHRC